MLLFRTNEVLFAYYGIYYYCIILWKPDYVVPSLSMEIAIDKPGDSDVSLQSLIFVII
jgi:hypothetical protein